MHDIVVLILRYARGTWRFRWWMLGIAWAISVVGWTVVAKLPDQYQASARVYVDTTSVLQPLLQGIAINTSDTQQKIFLMTRTLLSRPNLEKVMRMTDLDLQATTDSEKDEIIGNLKQNIRFRGTSRENLYTISYEAESADLAKLVVKSLLTIFMESNLGEVRKDQDSATQFLEQQKAEYERRMRELENELTRFKQRNMEFLPEGSGGYYERIRSGKKKIEDVQLELDVLLERLDTTRSQVEGEEPSFGLGPKTQGGEFTVKTPEIDRRIAAMQSKLDELTVKYTERHPDVIQARIALANLKAEKKRVVAEVEATGSSTSEIVDYNIDRNPVYQQMRLSLAQLEADVAAKQRLLDVHKSQVSELEASIDKVLALEAERRDLTADYDIVKKNHSVLETRLESAKLGRKAESTSDNVRFRVVDPPRAPSTPSGPNRVLLSSVVLLAGLAVGFGVAFLISQFRPTFDERQMLSDTLGLPVLGSVNMVWTSDQIRARKVRNVSFMLTLSGLLLTFGVVLALYQFNIELLPRLAQSLNLA
ncbi:XrtA system polysaccharide chain length determinant [Thiosocius teredinicola]|uniref:XrtA system polysaccharide chain length determinant n=1 Tax=Thiosocius teredinicola TaxID=1973002 RepID=UPI00099144BE